MSEYALIEKELTELLTKNLEKLKLPLVVNSTRFLIKKYFDNYRR